MSNGTESTTDPDRRSIYAAPVPAPGVELSVVLPCLDEVETLRACLRKAQDSVRRHAVADNGSQGIARTDDARARLSRTRIGED